MKSGPVDRCKLGYAVLVEALHGRRALADRRRERLGDGIGAGGKGAAARATLYFLLRYPGVVDDYDARDIKTLLKWHDEFPVSLYEKHRNAAIEETQGNRNPLIDFPEKARQIDFAAGLK